MARAVVTDDYYAILEVSPFAPLETIRESYKKLALKFHPDKNKDESATSDFQRLAIAWETLKDVTKRAEYDQSYARIPKRKREDVAKDDAESSRRRREDVEREARPQWAKEGETAQASSVTADEAGRRDRARAWQRITREDYVARLQTWIDFRRQRIPQVLELQRKLRQQEIDLEAQTGEDEEHVTQRFQEAIARSCSSGQRIQDQASTLAKLLEARRSYTLRLSEAVAESRKRLGQLVLELGDDRRRYEYEEGRARALRIRRALELLGPRDLNAPLFSMIDRRTQAINCWKALSRIKPAVEFPLSMEDINEGPWHVPGDWERVPGEQICGRCGERAFHLIAECGPFQCPGCGMIACIDCHRSVRLLQEYEKWVKSPVGASEDFLFSIVFESDVKQAKERAGASGFNGGFHTSYI